jgi:hypothetical protein
LAAAIRRQIVDVVKLSQHVIVEIDRVLKSFLQLVELLKRAAVFMRMLNVGSWIVAAISFDSGSSSRPASLSTS